MIVPLQPPAAHLTWDPYSRPDWVRWVVVVAPAPKLCTENALRESHLPVLQDVMCPKGEQIWGYVPLFSLSPILTPPNLALTMQ